MAVTEKKDKDLEKRSFNYRVTPRYTAWTEDDKIILRVVIPGVDPKDIEMKGLKDRFLMRAARDDVLYDLDLDLSVEIVPDKTKATYNQGLLRIELVKHNPLEDAYVVPIE